MSTNLLFGIVALQVLVFQFLYGRFAHGMAESQVGTRDLPQEVTLRLQAFRRNVRRSQAILGGLLWLAALLFAFLLDGGYTFRKLGLTGISLASSAILTVGYLIDHRTLAKLSAHLPGDGLRSAALEPRSLAQHYPPLWEAIPVLFFLATLAITIWAAPRSPAGAADLPGAWSVNFRLWILPFLQVTFLLFTWLMTLRLARGKSGLPQRTRPFVGEPEEVVALDQSLRRLELRALLAIKIAVMLKLNLMQLERVLDLTGQPAPESLRTGVWVLVACILVIFGIFVVRFSRLRKGLLP
jgi:hypothetical protein